MSTNAQISSELISWHGFSGNQQPKAELESNWNKPEGPQSSKRLISKTCREVLLNPQASQKEKLQAACILEKIIRLKELGSARKRLKKCAKTDNSGNSGQIESILEQVSS